MPYRSQKYRKINLIRARDLLALFLCVFVIANATILQAASALLSDGKNLVVWDIGGGSLQFSMRADGVGALQRKSVISAGHHFGP
jgi:hypothetical protein